MDSVLNNPESRGLLHVKYTFFKGKSTLIMRRNYVIIEGLIHKVVPSSKKQGIGDGQSQAGFNSGYTGCSPFYQKA